MKKQFGISVKGIKRIAQTVQPSIDREGPLLDEQGNPAADGFNQWVKVVNDFKESYKEYSFEGPPTPEIVEAQQQVWDALEALGPVIEAAYESMEE